MTCNPFDYPPPYLIFEWAEIIPIITYLCHIHVCRIEGDPNPHFEYKGLQHDIEVWAERGHMYDVHLFFIFHILIPIWLYKQHSLIESKDLLGASSVWHQHVTEALMYADDDLWDKSGLLVQDNTWDGLLCAI